MPTNPVASRFPFLLPDDPHDRVLQRNCHPPQHVNPTPTGAYNLIAIGAGAAGLVSSGGAGMLGAKAALIERALTGGDCLNTGCVPSKALIRAARAAYDARHAEAFGVRFAAPPHVDFAAVMERLRRLRAEISEVDAVARFRDVYNVDVYLGEAQFTSPTTLQVAGQSLSFKRCVIATGARATILPIPGLREAGCLTNETIFTLTNLPPRLAIIGGGAIGCELAQCFQRFGSCVTILNDVVRLLPREAEAAATILTEQFTREGITLKQPVKLLRVEQHGQAKVIVYEQAGATHELICDAILCAAGRTPNIEGLNLEAAGVRYDKSGVQVDERLRTANARIFAAGDICSPLKFTHAADAQARLVLRNALFFGRGKTTSLVLPWVTYTDPEIAHVGLTEAEAHADTTDRIAALSLDFAEVDRAKLDGETAGFARVYYQRSNGKLLGGTIVARHAGEMIGELTLAITHGLTLGDLAATIHPYPTQAEVLRKLGDAYQRLRLTPNRKALLTKWFAWRR